MHELSRPPNGYLAGRLGTLAGSGEAAVSRYRCTRCQQQRRPLLELLEVEPGRICGSLARLLALLAAVAPYELAARLAGLLLGVKISTRLRKEEPEGFGHGLLGPLAGSLGDTDEGGIGLSAAPVLGAVGHFASNDGWPQNALCAIIGRLDPFSLQEPQHPPSVMLQTNAIQ